ncbi:MAG: ornithine cyclodeaminase family protein [Candidatus Acidiferrales bacterium]|jgi:ornithine cyclodeaminase/alanine dehydrogenase-like protein (mu-crystallin family)
MALLLTEADVKSLLTMPLAMEAVETSFRRLADGSAVSHSRQRLRTAGKGYLHYMAAADSAGGYMGLKIYTVSPSGARFLVPLFGATTGEMVALIEANYLGQVRTGAASGVATRVLAREDASIAGIVGTGLQARTQLEAVALARKLEGVRAYSRDVGKREQFAKDMTQRLGLPVAAVSSAEEAVRGADIVITSTTSTKPVVEGRWLAPGTHVNAIGVNFAEKREIDAEAVRRCDVIAADSVEQSKLEAGDLIQAFGEDASRWASVREIADIVTGRIPGRTNRDQITMFKSNGIAIEDIVVAGKIYEMARERGMGREVPMWEGDR